LLNNRRHALHLVLQVCALVHKSLSLQIKAGGPPSRGLLPPPGQFVLSRAFRPP
jgi:hypothetical protein